MANSYPTYLVHFNRNHDSKNGQFTYGDGDADGVTNDHKNQKKPTSSRNSSNNTKTSRATSTSISKSSNNTKSSETTDSSNKKKKSLKRGSIFEDGSWSNYKNSDGSMDNDAYIKSGVKKVIAGAGMALVGTFLSNSDNLIASGAGYVMNYAGGFAIGYGGAQAITGAVNKATGNKLSDWAMSNANKWAKGLK